MNLSALFYSFVAQSEVIDKYVLTVVLLLFLAFSTKARREKCSMILIAISSFLVARLLITPLVHFVYYQPHLTSLAQLRLLASEQSAWTFPNGHAAFLLAIATAIYFANRKWGIGFLILVLFLNLSRMMAGVHTLAAMVGGMLIGLSTTCLIFYWAEKRKACHKRHFSSKHELSKTSAV